MWRRKPLRKRLTMRQRRQRAFRINHDRKLGRRLLRDVAQGDRAAFSAERLAIPF